MAADEPEGAPPRRADARHRRRREAEIYALINAAGRPRAGHRPRLLGAAGGARPLRPRAGPARGTARPASSPRARRRPRRHGRGHAARMTAETPADVPAPVDPVARADHGGRAARHLGRLLGADRGHLPDAAATCRLLARQMSVTSILAVGMVLVIVAGPDRPVGRRAWRASWARVAAIALHRRRTGRSPPPSSPRMVAGRSSGFLQGSLVARLRIPPFIVTLGGMLVFQGDAARLHGRRLRRSPRGRSCSWGRPTCRGASAGRLAGARGRSPRAGCAERRAPPRWRRLAVAGLWPSASPRC